MKIWDALFIDFTIMRKQDKVLRAFLECEADADTIAGVVAREAMQCTNPSDFFTDLMNNGCVCGMVSGLAWYNQTHAFYDYHYYEIEYMRQEWEEQMGEAMQVQ